MKLSNKNELNNIKLGEEKMMNCGMTAKIVRYTNAKDIDVEFEDGTLITGKNYSEYIRGKISPDPFELINGHRIRHSKLERLKKINPNLKFDFSTFDGSKIEATCISDSHCESYSINSLCKKSNSPERKGGGCKVCSGRVRKTNEQFDNDLKEKNPKLIRVSEYISAFEPIKIWCENCRKDFPTTPHNILNHPVCHYENPHYLTQEEFQEKLKRVKPHLIPIGKFSNEKTAILIRCENHPNNLFWATPDSLLQGKGMGCEECNNEKYRRERLLPEEDFKNRLSIINPDVEVIGQFRGTHKRIAVRYRSCGHESTPYVSNLLKGYGCRICKKTTYTTASFKKKMKRINPNIEIQGEYVNNRTHIKVLCKKCGYNWNPVPSQLLRGDNCPGCSCCHTSVVQEFIAVLFETMLGKDKVLLKDKSAIGKELDIYIPSMNLAFEPGAWVYHKNIINKDIEKRVLCNERGIRLITIYFGCDVDVAAKSEEGIYYLRNNLERFEDKKGFFEKLFIEKCNINLDFTLEELKKLELLAKRRATKNREKYKKDFNDKNSLFEMIGEFYGASEPVKFRCKKCGSEDKFDYYSMKNRKYCWNPDCECGRKKRESMDVTSEEFLNKYVDLRDDIERITDNNNPTDKIHLTVLCKNCGRLWNAPKYSLIKGRRHSCFMKKSTENFIEEMKMVNPNIEIRGEYLNAKTYIEYGYVGEVTSYYATPDSLLHGHGAAEKANNKKLTQEEFENKIKMLHPYLKILSKYKCRKGHITCECIYCGRKMEKAVETLYRERLKCPECGRNL